MTPKELDRLAVAADVSYAGALKRLAPVEAERRRLDAACEKARREAVVMAHADEGAIDAVSAGDLLAADAARRSALDRVKRYEEELRRLAPSLDEARRKVRKALAKTEVVAELRRRHAREARRTTDLAGG
ncbi:MAG: hypothetical protein AAFX08_03670 [Pseudomonadota bacterium]